MSAERAPRIEVLGQDPVLVERLRSALCRALADRHTYYTVRIDSVGRVGEVLVAITGSRGHLPLLFGRDETEPGYVFSVVRETVSRYGL